MEKSSKNLIFLFGEMPARGLPKPPPTPPRSESVDLHVEKVWLQDADTKSRRGIGKRRNGERGDVPRRLFLAAQQRIVITWRPKYYRKLSCFITRRNQKNLGQMSCKFGDIIKKLCIAVVKMSQAKPHA
jgi:hypothetical protein